jgi:hypothetical protein
MAPVTHPMMIARPKPTQKGGGFPAVTQLDQLDVGQDLCAPPEPRVHEHRDHPTERERPPEPVAGQAVPRHEARHRQRRVGGERRGHHRRAGDPPGQGPSRQEVLGDAPSRPRAKQEADAEGEREVRDDDGPVQTV